VLSERSRGWYGCTTTQPSDWTLTSLTKLSPTSERLVAVWRVISQYSGVLLCREFCGQRVLYLSWPARNIGVVRLWPYHRPLASTTISNTFFSSMPFLTKRNRSTPCQPANPPTLTRIARDRWKLSRKTRLQYILCVWQAGTITSHQPGSSGVEAKEGAAEERRYYTTFPTIESCRTQETTKSEGLFLSSNITAHSTGHTQCKQKPTHLTTCPERSPSLCYTTIKKESLKKNTALLPVCINTMRRFANPRIWVGGTVSHPLYCIFRSFNVCQSLFILTIQDIHLRGFWGAALIVASQNHSFLHHWLRQGSKTLSVWTRLITVPFSFQFSTIPSLDREDLTSLFGGIWLSLGEWFCTQSMLSAFFVSKRRNGTKCHGDQMTIVLSLSSWSCTTILGYSTAFSHSRYHFSITLQTALGEDRKLVICCGWNRPQTTAEGKMFRLYSKECGEGAPLQ